MKCGSLLSLRNTATYSPSIFILCFNCTDFCYNQANDVGLLFVNNIFTQQTHAAQNSTSFFEGKHLTPRGPLSAGRRNLKRKSIQFQLHSYTFIKRNAQTITRCWEKRHLQRPGSDMYLLANFCVPNIRGRVQMQCSCRSDSQYFHPEALLYEVKRSARYERRQQHKRNNTLPAHFASFLDGISGSM